VSVFLMVDEKDENPSSFEQREKRGFAGASCVVGPTGATDKKAVEQPYGSGTIPALPNYC